MHSCRTCGANFEWTEKEQRILEATSPSFGGKLYTIPSPKDCGTCRLRHVLCYLNETNLFMGKCAMTEKSIYTIYHPESPYTVIDAEAWWSDRFDALQYETPEFDWSKPFFPQFAALKQRVPRMHASVQGCESSPYVNCSGFMKNCYMVYGSSLSENCHYGYILWHNKDTLDCSVSSGCERSYALCDCLDCYQCYQLQDCNNCAECAFCFDCRGCKNCIGCVGLRNKEYHIWNRPVAKKEYDEFMERLHTSSRAEYEALASTFEEFRRAYPQNYMRAVNCEHVSGNYLNNSKDCRSLYNSQHCEHVYDSDEMFEAKDCISIFQWGEGLELAYMNIEVGGPAQRIAFCNSCWKTNENLYYCDYCMWSKDCFGCTGLKNKQYCIFNKQYTKEEYEHLVPKMITHMQASGEWGEFFPKELSHVAYNESLASLKFPRTREACIQEGLQWRERPITERPDGQDIASDKIADIDNSILQKVLRCEKSDRPYRIIPQELAFYLEHSLPLPRMCFDERLKKTLARRSSYVLYDRACTRCNTTLQTAYENANIVCEACYQAYITHRKTPGRSWGSLRTTDYVLRFIKAAAP